MVGVVLTLIVGLSIIVFIIRLIRGFLSGNMAQILTNGSDVYRPIYNPLDPLDPVNYGLSPGDVGYDEDPANR